MGSEAPLKVLLAEDNATTRMVVTAMLQGMGHAVTAVVNGAEAVEATRVERYDVVLMDMQMPVMDGPDATKTIRRREGERGETARLPIIALTADVRPEGKAAYLDAGADSVAGKPIDWRALLSEMRRLASGGTPSDQAMNYAPVQNFFEAIDKSVVDDLRKHIKAEAFAPLLTTFVTEISALQGRIYAAALAGDLRECKRAAHSLRGVSSSLGAVHAGEIAKLIERDVNSVAEVTAMLPTLVAAISAAKEVIAKDYGVGRQAETPAAAG